MSERLAKIEAERAARKAALADAHAEQMATDLEAISALEVEHGDGAIKVLKLPAAQYKPGVPMAYAVRCPLPAEFKRYTDKTKPRGDGKIGDVVAAAEDLAAITRVYPPHEREGHGEGDVLFAEACRVFPGLNKQLGLLAANLASGEAEKEGKD
jgi:hypothetical protein